GLPTLEAHRNIHPLHAAYQLLKYDIDVVCIGDTSIDLDIISRFHDYFNNGIVSRYIEEETPALKDVTGRIFHNRKDKARDVVRAEEARMSFQGEVKPDNTTERVKGTVTLDNLKYGRYMNELQIVKRDLEANEAVNVIGRVSSSNLDCINMIGAGQAFQFIKRG